MTGVVPGEGMPAPIIVVVNGEERPVEAGITLDGLLEVLGTRRRGVAVALDGEVVPRSAWRSSTLLAGARVEIVTAAAGG